MRCPMSMSGCDLRRRTERIMVMGAPAITSGVATESFACPQNYPGTCLEFTRSCFGLDACRPIKHFPEQRFVSGPNEPTKCEREQAYRKYLAADYDCANNSARAGRGFHFLNQ